MNLIIDIGNTSAKLVAFNGEQPIDDFRTSNTTLEGLLEFSNKYPFEKGILSSVFETTDQVEKQLSLLQFPLLRLNAETPIPIQNQYKTPHTLGADRLAAAIGAYSLFPEHDILIVDAGTCLTYEFIDSGGIYHGGNIAPGMQMRLKALHTYTAKLPLVKSDGETPELGFNTDTAIRSGVVQGMKFEIEGYINYFRKKYPHLLVFLTGGDNFNFDTTIKSIIFADKFIVPRGLNRILAYNNDKL